MEDPPSEVVWFLKIMWSYQHACMSVKALPAIAADPYQIVSSLTTPYVSRMHIYVLRI